MLKILFYGILALQICTATIQCSSGPISILSFDNALSKDQVLELLKTLENDKSSILVGQYSMNHRYDSRYSKYFIEPASQGRPVPALAGFGLVWSRICDTALIKEEIQGEEGPIERALHHWHNGGLVTMDMHPGNPFSAKPNVRDRSVLKKLSILTDTKLARERGYQDAERRWIRLLDIIAEELKRLDDAGVVVLFRPLHEMNGDWFWWGGQSAAEYKALWIHMHTYLTKEKGLSNLLWVYSPNVQNTPRIASTDHYYPGDEYVDVIAMDYYSDSFSYRGPDSPTGFNINNSYADLIKLGDGNKPFIMAEAGPETKTCIRKFDIKKYREILKLERVAAFQAWISWCVDNCDGSSGQAAQDNCVSLIDGANYDELFSMEGVIGLGDLPEYLTDAGFR